MSVYWCVHPPWYPNRLGLWFILPQFLFEYETECMFPPEDIIGLYRDEILSLNVISTLDFQGKDKDYSVH